MILIALPVRLHISQLSSSLVFTESPAISYDPSNHYARRTAHA